MPRLTVASGIGKTRLAVAVGERLGGQFDAATVFVALAAVTRSELVLDGIGRAAGAGLAATGSSLHALAETFGDAAGRQPSWLPGFPDAGERGSH